MKVLAYILTAAAVLIGADVFVMSSTAAQPADTAKIEEGIPLQGTSGIPTPPPDAY